MKMLIGFITALALVSAGLVILFIIFELRYRWQLYKLDKAFEAHMKRRKRTK